MHGSDAHQILPRAAEGASSRRNAVASNQKLYSVWIRAAKADSRGVKTAICSHLYYTLEAGELGEQIVNFSIYLSEYGMRREHSDRRVEGRNPPPPTIGSRYPGRTGFVFRRLAHVSPPVSVLLPVSPDRARLCSRRAISPGSNAVEDLNAL